MLESLPYEGTIRVRNKGVDITLLADAATVELAYAASRKLVVCGVSTAVLEVTCFAPIDTRTLQYYAETTPCMLAMTQKLYDAVKPYLPETEMIAIFSGSEENELLQTVRQMKQKKYAADLQSKS
nr:transketolase C-terminal domain-containing protein [uncultured Agathobaculum sp.]